MALISSNEYLTRSQMRDNASYVHNFFTKLGWTSNAICGMLGNMERESTLNPGLWESLDYENYSVGFGLVQWTPATNLTDWASKKGLDRGSIETQCKKIQDEYETGGQYYATPEYPLTFYQFSKSTESPEYLARAFCKNYERAGVEAMSERESNARYWYTQFGGRLIWTRNTLPVSSTSDPHIYYNSKSEGMRVGIATCIAGHFWNYYWNNYGLDVLQNCVGSALGCFNETYVLNTEGASWGDWPYAIPGNGEDIYANAPSNLQWAKTNRPPVGGMISWVKNHVAFICAVEYANEDGSPSPDDVIITMESGYQSNVSSPTGIAPNVIGSDNFDVLSASPSNYWGWRRDRHRRGPDSNWSYAGSVCNGFVINPAIGTGVFKTNQIDHSDSFTPGPTPNPEITNIESISSTKIKISGASNGSEQVVLYIKWNSNSVSMSDYDEIITTNNSTFTIDVAKPREAYSVAVIPVRGIYIGTVFTKDGLIVSIPCINIYTDNDFLQAIPYVYTNGQWKKSVPMLYTKGQWFKIYNDKK